MKRVENISEKELNKIKRLIGALLSQMNSFVNSAAPMNEELLY